MQQELTQSEVEWLRCLTVSLRLTPVLPENVRLKLEGAQFLEANSGKTVITESGTALLRQRTPQEPVAPAYVSG
jgi:hypothetical protein